MKIKEFADKVREEIKRVNEEIDAVRILTIWSNVDDYNKAMISIAEKKAHVSGLNKALDIYLDLEKGDL